MNVIFSKLYGVKNLLLAIDICTAQKALTITYSSKGSGFYRTAVFSRLIENVAYDCQIAQKLNTIKKISEHFEVEFELIVKDRGADIKAAHKMSLLSDVETIDCIGGLLVDFLNYLESGLPISKNGKTFNCPPKVQPCHRGISDVGFYENLSITLNNTIDLMQPKEKSSDLQKLSKCFESLHEKLKSGLLIDKSERKFLKEVNSELESWSINADSKVLTNLKAEINKCITLSTTEHGLHYADATVYETEKRHDSHGVRMSYRKKWGLMRIYKDQFHTISKLKYKRNKLTSAPHRTFNKFVRCEICGELVVGKKKFRNHYIAHFQPDAEGIFVSFFFFF